MTNERNQLALLGELSVTNEELVTTQTAQIDELRRQLKEAQERIGDHERLRAQLTGADERIRALDVALTNYVAESTELRQRADASDATLNDERRRHVAALDAMRIECERRLGELAQQNDELRGVGRIAQAAAAECSAQLDELRRRHEALVAECNSAKSSLSVLPTVQQDVRSIESELHDAYRRLETSER
jgi:chromosome segregation ATPase